MPPFPPLLLLVRNYYFINLSKHQKYQRLETPH